MVRGRISRLERLEARHSRNCDYVVFYREGETPEEAIARVKPTRSFILAPEPCATVEEWEEWVALDEKTRARNHECAS
jgi:hypothetical protein